MVPVDEGDFYYLKGRARVSRGESQPPLPTSCLKTAVIKQIIEGEDLVLMFSFTFRAERTCIFMSFRIQPSWVFPIASKFITVSYALSPYPFLNIIIRIQITYCLPLISEDLCYLFYVKDESLPIPKWYVGLVQNLKSDSILNIVPGLYTWDCNIKSVLKYRFGSWFDSHITFLRYFPVPVTNLFSGLWQE